MKVQMICPVCEEGELTPGVFSSDVKHASGIVSVEGLECYVCDTCGADPVLEDQIKRNHARIVDAKRVATGLLTGKQIKEFRRAVGLTQQQAAELFGGGQNAFSKYERGDVIQSAAMDRLIRCSWRIPSVLDCLAEISGIPGWQPNYSYHQQSEEGQRVTVQGSKIVRPPDQKAVRSEGWAKAA